MTRSPVKVPLSSETVKAVKVENWRQLELRTPCEKFLVTPLPLVTSSSLLQSREIFPIAVNSIEQCYF